MRYCSAASESTGPIWFTFNPHMLTLYHLMLSGFGSALLPLITLWPLLFTPNIGLAQTMTNKLGSTNDSSATAQLATLGGGCFWCTEAVFQKLEGVQSVTSGYAGGQTVKPTYQEICSGKTGHAEVIQVKFDPRKISYETLLDVFWEAHDPTTLNRQGADHGTQYRSIILYHNESQQRAAEQSKKAAAPRFKDAITTEIQLLRTFYPAEKYHQDYFSNNSNAPYCRIVIRPKLEKLQKSGRIK